VPEFTGVAVRMGSKAPPLIIGMREGDERADAEIEKLIHLEELTEIVNALKISRLPLGILGISICGAVGHNFGQLLMVRLLLVPNDGIFHLTPLLIIVGMVTGIITGSIAWKVVQAVKGDYEEIHR